MAGEIYRVTGPFDLIAVRMEGRSPELIRFPFPS
jgi:hypothetical protein